MSMMTEASLPCLGSKTPLFKNFPDLVLLTNDEGYILDSNERLQDFLGYSPEELQGKRLDDFLFGRISKNSIFKKPMECRIKAKDGTILPVEIRSYDCEYQEHSIVSVIRDLRDFTEIRNSILEKGRTFAINELAPSMILNIRNSLAILTAQNYFMRQKVDKLDSQKVLDGLRIMHRASSKLEDISKQLDDWIERAETLEKVSLHELVERCILLLEPQSRRCSIVIQNEVPTDLNLFCDPMLIEQTLIHILKNAFDALNESAKKFVHIDAEKTKDSTKIRIRDAGKGMTEEHQKHIFDAFFTDKQKPEKQGLGLYICKQNMSRHSGSIHVESALHEGSTFTLTIPHLKP